MTILPIHDTLCSHSRLALPRLESTRTFPAEMLVLLFLGAAAACLTELLDFSLRLPGHAILRGVLPMTLGMALAPRVGSGTVMGAGALVTSLGLSALGVQKGLGSMVSISLVGPLMDLAMVGARRGWRVYVGIVLAALVANLIAFAVQYVAKRTGASLGPGSGMGGGVGMGMGGGFGGGMGRKRAFAEWFAIAMVTYPLWGLVAGVLSAVVFFRWRGKENS